MLQPQAVIFDIGNVLIEWHPEAFYDARDWRPNGASCLSMQVAHPCMPI
jgi:FMN phosphatase YigB (HAD superfamily)